MTTEWKDPEQEPPGWPEFLSSMENYADEKGIQVLVVEDISAVVLHEPPYRGNVVIDSNYIVAIPKEKPKNTYWILGSCAFVMVIGLVAIVNTVLGWLS